MGSGHTTPQLKPSIFEPASNAQLLATIMVVVTREKSLASKLNLT